MGKGESAIRATAITWLVLIAGEGILDAQLVGKPLSEYPYFQYVGAVNPDTSVWVAVDPTLFPELAGATCDLFVVRSRGAQEWSSDPTLDDVRPAGAQAVSFAGATIQQNTFLIGSTAELTRDAGPGLGVGYDVVLDCDRNGTLDSGDTIDGRGSEAGFYAVHDTTLPGPLAVSVLDYGTGFLTQRTYYPADIASLGQLPLIVISHGWTHLHTWYDHIGNHLASYGYFVMSHSNDVGDGGPGGTTTASTTTLTNTDFILGSQAAIAGAAVRFDFGSDFGSERGRIGLDDIELVDHAAAPPFVLTVDRNGAVSSIRWPAAPRALAFNVCRGALPPGGFAERGAGNEVYDHGCLEAADAAGDGPFLSQDAAPVPPDRAGFYYLVSVVTQDGEGTLGDASIDLDPASGDQWQRPNGAPCPGALLAAVP